MAGRQRKVLSDKVLEKVGERLKLLSEPMRLRLLYSLTDGEKSVSKLVRDTGALRANVSKHLGMLLDAGVVRRRKQGLNSYYSVADESIYDLCELVCESLYDQLAAELEDFSSSPTREARSREDDS
jgi:DNA-binding transcriptional ArsR family regulator